jgi:chaperone BCS1
MTTNCPSALDLALLRPGRIDLQIGFTLASRGQIRNIYQHMYVEVSDPKASQDTKDNCEASGENCRTNDRIEELAIEFASGFPEKTFPPAEIQNYLLERKRDPEGAIRESKKWQENQLRLRGEREKIQDNGIREDL